MKSDYDTDFFAWTQHQAAALVAGHMSELDLINLAEEIESLGKRDRRELASRLGVLVMHLLKWYYQPDMRQTGQSWRRTIRTQRRDIERLLKQSPSLRRLIADMVEEDFRHMRFDASDETGLPMEAFPDTCPWTIEQILDEAFWPDDV